ncbi:phospholipase A and acyltransferase 5-like [Symsagittifera roscoffensis]|uniref:phospholipase A and acyltransferase 5-like n=1 Tax=Symsagittifera roscoffensis TaxID=84072 RepID=UPI00307CAAE9
MARKEKKKPVPGDMIRIERKLYSHWGVCVSKDRMVHLSPPGQNNELNMIKSLGMAMNVQVMVSKIEDVAQGNVYYADNYLDGEEGFNPHPVKDIVGYAMHQVEEPEQDFDLVWNNCEKFAIMCRYREYHPGKQAERGILASVATAAGLVAASATALVAMILFR